MVLEGLRDMLNCARTGVYGWCCGECEVGSWFLGSGAGRDGLGELVIVSVRDVLVRGLLLEIPAHGALEP